MRHLFSLLLVATFTLLAAHAAQQSIHISTIEELVEYATRDNVNVTMKAGTYKIDNAKFAKTLKITKYSATSSPASQKPREIDMTTYLHFAGNNSTYNLEDVTVKISTDLRKQQTAPQLFEIYVSGNNNIIKGLKAEDVGETHPAGSGVMVHIIGDDNTLDGVNIVVRGSSPYGYGHLLGKGKPTGLVDLNKFSSLLVSGCDTKLLNCRVITHSYGHGIVMQGAVNTYIEGCYVEGRLRPSDAMLKETDGVAFESGFKTIYPPGVIEPNRMIALSEDGIRTYPHGGYIGRRTEALTVVNSTVKGMRSGVDASVHIPPTLIKGCTTLDCQEKGYSVGNGAAIVDSRGDAKYGPLLTYQRKDVKNTYVELELIASQSKYKVERMAEISGTGHYIKLTNYNGEANPRELPIVFGETFWGDVHIFRNPTEEPSKYAFATNVTLINETGMPTIFSAQSKDCRLFTNGEVKEDKGENNSVSELSNEIKVYNCGVGGNSSADILRRLEGDVVSRCPEFTIVMVGTNDLLNSRRVVSYDKYKENLTLIVQRLKAVGSDVLLMSVIPADAEYLLQRHDASKLAGKPKDITARAAEIAKGVADEQDCYFLDMHAEFVKRGIPKHNSDEYIKNEKNSRKKDGVHPTPAGYKLMSDIIWAFMEQSELVTRYRTIICLGDSITNGGGNASGKNYPTYLKQNLNR